MCRHGLVEQAQKLEPLLVAMPFLTKPVDLAVGRIEGGEKSSRAIAFVIVCHGLAAPTLERQSGLGTIQSLDLTFLVHAQHQSVFGRVQIQADDIFQFFRELRIAADLETLDAVRLQPVTVPDTTHAGLADAYRCRHAARTPVRGVRRLLPRRHIHHTPNQMGSDPRSPARPGRVPLQTRHAQSEEPFTPTRYLLGRDLHHAGHFFVLSVLRDQQPDARSFDHSRRKRPAARALLQPGSLLGTQSNGWGDPHPLLSCSLDGSGSIMVVTYDALH